MGSIRSVFVEDGPDSNPAPAPPRVQGITPPTVPALPTPSVWHASAPTPADPAVLAKLQARLEQVATPAYQAFREQCENLKDIIPDEATRVRAAIKASKTTTDLVLTGVQQLVGALDTARTVFTQQWEDNRRKQLADAEASLKATDDQIASYEQQIKTLQDTIASLRNKRAADATAVGAESTKLDVLKSNFEGAWAQVAGQLENQRQRIASLPKV